MKNPDLRHNQVQVTAENQERPTNSQIGKAGSYRHDVISSVKTRRVIKLPAIFRLIGDDVLEGHLTRRHSTELLVQIYNEIIALIVSVLYQYVGRFATVNNTWRSQQSCCRKTDHVEAKWTITIEMGPHSLEHYPGWVFAYV